MHPSRSLLRTALPAVAGGLLLAACSASPAPTGVIAAAPSASPAAAAQSPVPSDEPSPSFVVIPDESAEPGQPSAEPSGEATEEPGGPSTPPEPANPSAKPIPPAPADCGTGDAAFDAHGGEVPEVLHFGGATIELTTAGRYMRDDSAGGDDVIPGGIGLTANEIAVRVDPGTHIILRGSGTSLTNLSVGSVSWSSVSFSGGLGSSSETPVALAWRFGANGTISVTAPTEPGDYMVSFGVEWFTHCLKGDGIAYGRIKVNG